MDDLVVRPQGIATLPQEHLVCVTLSKIDKAAGYRLEHKLVLLELSQKAAELYPSKSPEQKRLLASKLFNKMTINAGRLSVEFTNFAQAIAERVEKTRNLMEAE